MGLHYKLLIASPIRNIVGKNKNLVGYLDSGAYTYIESKQDVGNLKSLLMYIYLNVINAMKFSVSDHRFFKLDGRFLQSMTMLYINIMPKNYDVKIDEYNYNNFFINEDSYPFYPLSVFIVEKDNNVFFEYAFSNEYYTNEDITLIHKHFQEVMSGINKEICFNY